MNIKYKLTDFLKEQNQNEMSNNDMKSLINKALDEAFVVLKKRVPLTKTKTESISLFNNNVEPKNLLSFMKEHSIPDDAYFSGSNNDFDGFDDFLLCWDIDVPTTEQDKLRFKRDKFTHIAWKYVFNTLTNNGYKRISFNTGLLSQYRDTTVYDMYINKDFDKLVSYYSLPFIEK